MPAGIGVALAKPLLGHPFKISDPVKPANYVAPPYLKPGDTIAITCPAGPADIEDLQPCLNALQNWGYKVRFGNTVGKKWQRFGGTDDERAADMQRLINDKTVDAIMFGRGGYGIMRMMDSINWDSFVQHPKWLIGYSDITAFHCHVNNVLGIPTLHADMGNGFGPDDDIAADSLQQVLRGKPINYTVGGFSKNRAGTATGKLVGGNLSLIYAMQGSKSAIETEGKILVIEDVSEYKYTVDRMLMNLKRSGKLDNLAGLIVGGFTATKADTEGNFPMSMEEIIFEKVKEFEYPVCFHFPCGHQKENLALKLGVNYSLSITKNKVSLMEMKAASLLAPQALSVDSSRMQPDSLQLKPDSLLNSLDSTGILKSP